MPKQLHSPDEIASFVAVPEQQFRPPPWPDGCPQPGLHKDASYDDYAHWPAVNASALKWGYEVSPLHMKTQIDGLLGGDSRARKFGRAVHCRLLEPTNYRGRFYVAQACKEALASGPRKGEPCGKEGRFYGMDANGNGEWFCGTHAKNHPEAKEPKEYISQAEAGHIESMAKSVYRHKVSRLLHTIGGCEVSIVWERDGLACKARFDKLIIDQKCPDTIIDLKKCRVGKASNDAIQSAVREYCWDLQAAWYVDGVQRLLDKSCLFAWIFLEDGPPFDVRPVWASPAMLEVGKIKAERAFEAYRQCVQWDRWPGYCSDIEQINPADWEMKRYSITP